MQLKKMDARAARIALGLTIDLVGATRVATGSEFSTAEWLVKA